MSLHLFPVLWIFLRFLCVICYDRWVLSEGHKNCFKYQCLMNSQPTFHELTSQPPKGCKPDNLESNNSLKLSFTNIWGLHLNFVECESFLESNSAEILVVCETNLDSSIDPGNFCLIWKDPVTHIHGLAVYKIERLPFVWNLHLEHSADSYLCFELVLLHSVPYFFFLYWSPSLSLFAIFDSVSCNIDEVLSINPSANGHISKC